jgi:hypothetical protein
MLGRREEGEQRGEEGFIPKLGSEKQCERSSSFLDVSDSTGKSG